MRGRGGIERRNREGEGEDRMGERSEGEGKRRE